mmetsp:Transcript_79310/g.201888  ORF Transcript_79310/g.201888 Transcript_79310/m.201888 type:complete len:202 (-) Transcript_79310:138-743(-)
MLPLVQTGPGARRRGARLGAPRASRVQAVGPGYTGGGVLAGAVFQPGSAEVRRHLRRRVHVHPPHPTGGLHGGQAHEQDLPLGRVPQIHQVVAARSTRRDPVRLRAARCLPLRSCCGAIGRPGAPGAGGGHGVGAARARASQHHLSVEVACGCWHVGAGGISHPDPRDIWSGHAFLGVGSEKWELQRIFRSPRLDGLLHDG